MTVPRGSEVASDPIALPIRAGQNLAISIYAPASTGTATIAGSLNHTNYMSGVGDATAATGGRQLPGQRSRPGYWIGGIDVTPRDRDAGAVVALGDSITAGFDSTENANVDAQTVHVKVVNEPSARKSGSRASCYGIPKRYSYRPSRAVGPATYSAERSASISRRSLVASRESWLR